MERARLSPADGERRSLLERIAELEKLLGEQRSVEANLRARVDDLESEPTPDKLAPSDQQFRRGVLDAPMPIMIHAEDGEVVQINRTWTEITGYSVKDIPTIAVWTRRAYGEACEITKSRIEVLYDIGERVDEGDYVITTADGRERTWHFYSSPLGKLPDGRRAVISMAADVTEERSAEQALRKSEAQLRSAQRLAHLGSWTWDIGKDQISRTEECGHAFGLEPHELPSTYKEFLARVHPDDRANVNDGINAVLQYRASYTTEHRIVQPSGAVRYVMARGELERDVRGRPLRLHGTTLDITELKRAESALRASRDEFEQRVMQRTHELAQSNEDLKVEIAERRRAETEARRSEQEVRLITDNLPAYVSYVDKNRRIGFMNGYHADLFGRSRRKVEGKHVRDVIGKETYRAVETYMDSALGGQQTSFDISIDDDAGEKHWLQGTYVPRISEQGDVEGFYALVRDVTDRKVAEAKAHAAENLYRTLFQQSPDAIVLIDRETTRPVEFNELAPKLLGYTPEEFAKLRVSDFEAVETAEEIRERVEKVLREGHDKFETKMRCKNGDLRDVLVSARVLDIAGRKVFHNIFRDITERKKSEASLQRTQYAIDHGTDPIYWVRADGRIAYVNEAATRALGYSSEELLSMAVSDIDPDFPQDVWPDHWENMKRTRSMTFDAHHRKKSGFVFPVEVHIDFVEYEGDGYIWAYVRDNTERHRSSDALEASENKMRAVLQSAADSIIVIDDRGSIELLNAAAESLFGYAADEIVGKNIRYLMPEPYRSAHDGYLRRFLETGVSGVLGQRRELKALLKDGTSIPIELNASEVSIGSTRVFVGIVTDLRERRKTEELLRRAERLASIGTLAAGIAHEINNPLGAILISANYALTSLGDRASAREAIEDIVSDVGRCTQIVKSVLTMASVSPAPVRKAIDVNGPVRTASRLAKHYATSEDVAVELSLAPSLPQVRGSSLEIEQVLVNLITNAVRASQDGGKVIVTTSADRDHVTLSVSDTGAGMSLESVQHAFDPFFTTNAAEGGSGLGLSLSHSIVAALQGKIWIDTEQKGGTKVCVELPRDDRCDGVREAASGETGDATT